MVQEKRTVGGEDGGAAQEEAAKEVLLRLRGQSLSGQAQGPDRPRGGGVHDRPHWPTRFNQVMRN